MAVVKANWTNEVYKSPNTKVNLAETIPPLVKNGTLGKYVFLYDYDVTIYTPEAQKIMSSSPIGQSYTLPVGSFYNLRYSKGDVVNVIGLDGYKTATPSSPNGSVFQTNPNLLIINVPRYVTPVATTNTSDVPVDLSKSFAPTVTIDNSLNDWLQKVADSTPETSKFGVNFGKNLNPKIQPKTITPSPTPTTQTPTTPVIVNGIEETSTDGGFFSDTNNLIMVAVVLVVGYLLLDNKTE